MRYTSIFFAVAVLAVAVMAQVPTQNFYEDNAEPLIFGRLRRFVRSVRNAGRKFGNGIKKGATFAGKKISFGAKYTGGKISFGAKFAGKHIARGAKYTGRKIVFGAKYTGNKIVQGAKYVGNQIEQGIYKMMRYGNHCGKGHGTADKPVIDAVDRACYNHDRCYEGTEFGNCACDMDAIVEMKSAKSKVGWKGKLVVKAALLWLKKHGCKCIDPTTCRISTNKNLKPGDMCNYKCRN